VTTVTRTTTVRPGVVAAAPAYDELMRGPRRYDVVTPAPAAAPAVQPAIPAVPVVGATTAIAAPMAMPAYRYIYQPDHILVVDPYTNIAVQAIPR
jgi:hypothetical protein